MKDLNKITTEMMEHICDSICRFPRESKDPDELEGICVGCKMGKFVFDIINPGKSNLEKLTTIESMAKLMSEGNIEGLSDTACIWVESKHNGGCIHGDDGPGDMDKCEECYKAWLQEEAVE